jgi:hypothetical protein
MPKGHLPQDPESRGRVIAGREGWVQRGVEPGTYVVADLATRKLKIVQVQDSTTSCSCGATSDQVCEHVWAVRAFHPECKPKARPPPAPKSEERLALERGFRRGQEAEYEWFEPLLFGLLDFVEDDRKWPRGRGQPKTPLREALYVTALKSHERLSGSRLRGQFAGAVARGCLSKKWNYSLPCRTLGREDLTPVLTALIRESAKPVRGLEEGGILALDSTGFVTTVPCRYVETAHGVKRHLEFMKAHCGVPSRTYEIADVVVTDNHESDYAQFGHLLKGVLESGFDPEYAVADAAFSGRSNYAIADELGVVLRTPFRKGSSSAPKGVRSWRDAFYAFQLHKEEWHETYRYRSAVEGAFSSLKRLLGESLLSKRPVARRNEILVRILVYNVITVIRHAVARGIDLGDLFGDRDQAEPSTLPPSNPPDTEPVWEEVSPVPTPVYERIETTMKEFAPSRL